MTISKEVEPVSDFDTAQTEDEQSQAPTSAPETSTVGAAARLLGAADDEILGSPAPDEGSLLQAQADLGGEEPVEDVAEELATDRKSTRLNSSHW